MFRFSFGSAQPAVVVMVAVVVAVVAVIVGRRHATTRLSSPECIAHSPAHACHRSGTGCGVVLLFPTWMEAGVPTLIHERAAERRGEEREGAMGCWDVRPRARRSRGGCAQRERCAEWRSYWSGLVKRDAKEVLQPLYTSHRHM